MKFLIVGAVLALSMGLAACGGGESHKPPSCGPASRSLIGCPNGFPQPPSFSNFGTSLSVSGTTAHFKPTTTVPVEVNDNWHITWGYSNCLDGVGIFEVSIYNQGVDTPGVPDFNASLGFNKMGTGGIGTQHYTNDGGYKYFQITSDCDWSIAAGSN
jgi:hypothetical protein